METKQKVEELFKKVNTFILSCIDADGYPMTKAVVPDSRRDSIGEIYFCTNTSSKFASAVAANKKACVYFNTRRLIWAGCYLRGTMEIVTDIEVKKQHWQEKFKNAYPKKNYTDPDFCVLKFIPEKGRYYSWYKIEDFII